MKAKLIAISSNGFITHFEVEADIDSRELIDKLPALERALIARGYRPNGQLPRSPEGLPICPRHGEVLRPREKQGDAWFSHKVVDANGEIVYCKGRPGADSPGWDIMP